MTDPIFDLTSEPWCWHPDQIARLTDFQILSIREEQSKRVEKHMPKQGPQEQPLPPTMTNDVPPPESPPEPFARSGAQWDYAIKSGMSPEQAEAFLRTRHGR